MRISDWISDVCSSDLIDSVEGPAVPLGDQLQFVLGFREGYIENALALADPFEQELQRNGGLARARATFVQVHAVGVEAAAENVIQPLAASGNARGFIVRSEEHTSELQSLMRISYAVFCLKKKNKQ